MINILINSIHNIFREPSIINGYCIHNFLTLMPNHYIVKGGYNVKVCTKFNFSVLLLGITMTVNCPKWWPIHDPFWQSKAVKTETCPVDEYASLPI